MTLKKSLQPKQLHPLKAESIARDLFDKMENGIGTFSVYEINGGHTPQMVIAGVRAAMKRLYGKYLYSLDWGYLNPEDKSKVGMRIVFAAQKVSK